MPLQPKHLDYVNTQFLVIGESQGLDKATQPQSQDEKEGKQNPLEEMEQLEGEDEIRVKHLKGTNRLSLGHIHIFVQGAKRSLGDDAIFADLHISAKEYPKVQTTW